jgi:ATP-binding protein involved in chromosome partitioning
MIDKNEIMKVLAQIEDPELRRPLTDLGMVKFIEIEGKDIKVGISLTIPGCPLKQKIQDDIIQKVGFMEGVGRVEIVFDAMSDEQRKSLMQKLYGENHGNQKGFHRNGAIVMGDFAKRVIAVASGKGGVGKSTVTANLAAALGRLGYKVAVLDADVYGFSIPRMLGISGKPTEIDDNIVPLRRENIQVISMGFFVEEDMPVIWRGPLLHKAISQFLTDVLWDKSDFLLLDLPPGTGDVTLTIAQSIPKAELLVVTTPQPAASHTAGRVARLAEKTNLKILGVVENMSYYETNGKREYIFGKDGGKQLAQTLSVPFLGEIPIKTEIREGADMGNPAAFSENNEIAQYYLQIASMIAKGNS